MASIKDRIRKLLGRNVKQQQTNGLASTHSNAVAQQQQPIVQHDGPSDSQQKTVQTQNRSATATGSLQIQLQNRTNSSTVYAYISE